MCILPYTLTVLVCGSQTWSAPHLTGSLGLEHSKDPTCQKGKWGTLPFIDCASSHPHVPPVLNIV